MTDLHVASQVARRVAEARRAAGLSQVELAARSRTASSTVVTCESGKTCPRVDTLAAWAEACGVTLADLVHGVSVACATRG